MIGRRSVFEGIGAAGVRGNVACQRADRPAPGLRRKPQSRSGERQIQTTMRNPGLDPGDAVLDIDIDDLVQSGKTENDGVFCRRCRAAEAGASAPSHHFHALVLAIRKYERRFGCICRQDDREGHTPHRCPGIGIENTAARVVRDDGFGADDTVQATENFVAPTENLRCRCRQHHGRHCICHFA